MDTLRIIVLVIVMGFGFITPVYAYDHCSENSKSCTLAIFPHSNYKQLLITYKSVLEDLSLILDTRVKLVSTRTMSEFSFKLDKNAYDMALMGSGQYISHGYEAGYLPLASREGSLKTRLFVKSSSEIHSYDDLKGRRLGFMEVNTTTWYSANILLQKYNVSKKDIELVKLGSQQACAHALAINKVEACFFAVANLGIIQQQNVNIDVKPIGDTLRVNNPVYAVHPNMPIAIIDEIKAYFLSREGYVAVNDADFSEFRDAISALKK